MITEVVFVHDQEARSLHQILIHYVDYHPQRSSAVGEVVAFSKSPYAAFRTKKLQLATPAYYRDQDDLKPGIRDLHEGKLTKDATKWASTVLSAGVVTNAELTFVASSEPWIYCASHYNLNSDLRRLKDLFADEYGYTTATGISDPNSFATWLGIDFALTLDKATEVRLGPLDKIGYAQSRYETDLWQGSGPIDTIVRVYHGPVHYEDSSGRISTQEEWFDPAAGPKAWFTKKTPFKNQSEYRFAVSTLGDPVKTKHYITVSPELSEITFPL